MSRIVDLTIVYGGPRWSHPFLFEKVRIETIHTHAVHGRSNTAIFTPCHVGTHIDAPFHFVPDGISIEEVPVDRLMGEAIQLDVRAIARSREPVTLDEVKRLGVDGDRLRGKIVVFHTGWAEKAYGEPRYYGDHPHIAVDTARWLAGLAIKSLAVDTIVDKVEPPRPGDNPVHRTLLGAGIPLIENVLNLHLLPPDGFTIIALPLRIKGSDGAPARVIAQIPD